MASIGPGAGTVGDMGAVLEALKAIQENQSKLAAEVESVSHRLDTLAPPAHSPTLNEKSSPENGSSLPAVAALPQAALTTSQKEDSKTLQAEKAENAGFTSRIILT